MNSSNVSSAHRSYAACLVVVLLLLSPAAALAGPDPDGAVDALISWPMDAVGDGMGAIGLATASVFGLGGDIIALVDDNRYSRVVLRGMFSKLVRGTASGISQMSSGTLEGFRGEDFTAFPEARDSYMNPRDLTPRSETFAKGLGSLGLGVVDFVANPIVAILRGTGMSTQADDVAKFQTDSRDSWIGTVQ